jgi:hypothetical protein
MSNYAIVERAPTVEEFQALRVAVGWGRVDDGAAAVSLRNTLY